MDIENKISLMARAYMKAPVAIVLSALDGSWVLVNDATNKLTGFDDDDIIENTKREFVKITTTNSEFYQLNDVLSGKIKDFSVTMRYERKDKTIIWIKVTVSLGDVDGKSPFIIALMEDVDQAFKDRIELQRKLEELSALNKLMINRELKMIKLKARIEELEGSKATGDSQ